MNKLFKKYWLALFTPFTIYLCAAFIGWDFNPGNWSFAGRFVTGLFMLVFMFICTAIIKEYSND